MGTYHHAPRQYPLARRNRPRALALRLRARSLPLDNTPPTSTSEGDEAVPAPILIIPPVPPPQQEPEQDSDNENEFDAADAQGGEDDDTLSLPEGVSKDQETGIEIPQEPLPEPWQPPPTTTRSGREVKHPRQAFGDEWANSAGFYSGRKKV